MGAFRRTVQFTKGGVLGAAIGVGAALLLSPASGDDLRGRFAERVRRTREAGDAAAKQAEADLVARFRAEVNDPSALAADPPPPTTSRT